jgi:uncharacterized membrane protein
MKRTVTVFILGTMISLLAFSCRKDSDDEGYTPECSGDAPKFAANVNPLIQSRCATSGCHAAGSGNGPGALDNHGHIKHNASAIRSAVASGRMPKNGTLTKEEKNRIICWIDAGAKND